MSKSKPQPAPEPFFTVVLFPPAQSERTYHHCKQVRYDDDSIEFITETDVHHESNLDWEITAENGDSLDILDTIESRG